MALYADLVVSLAYSWFNSTCEWQRPTQVPLSLKISIAVKLFELFIQVQKIYLTVLATANSFRKLCLTATENDVAWHKLDEY